MNLKATLNQDGQEIILMIFLASGYFNFCVPLKMVLGFVEYFNKVILNSKHELTLLRSKDDS